MHTKLISVAEAAQRLALSPKTLRKWVAHGIIGVCRIGPRGMDVVGRDTRTVRIPEIEIERLIDFTPAQEVPR